MIIKLTFNTSNAFVSVTQGAPIYVKVIQGAVSGGGSSDWADITNKPSTFTPSAHTHPISDVTGLQSALDGKQETLVSATNIKTINGASVLGSGNISIATGGGTWGSISGVLSNQTDLQTALNAKENAITSGTTAQYFRGDKTFQTLDKAAVGLGNVDNTSDANKPVSTAQQTALNGKANTSHSHVISDVTGLQTALDGKQANITGTDGQVVFKSGSTPGVVTTGALAYPDIPLFIQQTQPTPTTYSYQWNQVDSNGDLITIWHFKP